MARGWISSRDMLSGTSPNEALVGIAGDLNADFQRRSDEEINELGQVTYVHQTSNAGIARMKERQAIFSKLTAEHAKNPDLAKEAFLKDKETIRERILSGVTQTRAKRVATVETDEELARWEVELEQWGQKQKAKNGEIDFVVQRDDILKGSVQYPDESGMLADLGSAYEFADTNHNSDGLPTHADVATPEVVNATKRAFAEKIVGDYLTQQAIAGDDEKIIDGANEFVESRGIIEQGHGEKPLFGPEKLAEIKGRVKAASAAARTEANKAKTDRAAAFEKQMTIGLLKGEFNIPNDKGNPVNARETILNNPDLSPAKIRTLTNLYDKKTGTGKKASVEDRLEAYGKVNQAWMDLTAHKINQADADKILHENLLTLDEEDAEMFIEKIGAGPKANESDADKRSDALQQDALTIINPAIEKWARNILGAQKDTSALLQIKGDFAKRLRDAVAPEIAAGERVDRAKLYEEAITILSQMQDERKPKQKEKRPGLLQPLPIRNTVVIGGTAAGTGFIKQKSESSLPKPQSESEYKALAVGTRYRHPDGSIKVKQ